MTVSALLRMVERHCEAVAHPPGKDFLAPPRWLRLVVVFGLCMAGAFLAWACNVSKCAPSAANVEVEFTNTP